MKTFITKITLLFGIIVLTNACQSGANNDDPTPAGGSNSFTATVDGKSWKAIKATGGQAIVGGLVTIAGTVSDTEQMSIQLAGAGLKTGQDYAFTIPAKAENNNANLIYNKGGVLFAASGKVRFTTFSTKQIEGTFEAEVTDYINAKSSIKDGKFSINF
jgi:hypothetical protein